jgi:hypothetical protein
MRTGKLLKRENSNIRPYILGYDVEAGTEDEGAGK